MCGEDEKVEAFIHKLHRIICNERSGLRWAEDGRALFARDDSDFSQSVAQELGVRKFISFTRKLTKYGFTRCKVTPHTFRFYHKHFTQYTTTLHLVKKKTQQDLIPRHIKLQQINESNNRSSSPTSAPFEGASLVQRFFC